MKSAEKKLTPKVLNLNWSQFKHQLSGILDERVTSDELDRAQSSQRSLFGLIEDKLGILDEVQKTKLHAMMTRYFSTLKSEIPDRP